MIFLSLIILILVVIFYQDLKHRSVLWLLFPALFLLNIAYNWEAIHWVNSLISLAFIAFLLVSLTLYLSIKTGRLVAVWKGFFSLGDILFILAITPLFTWIQFVYFFTFGTIVVLLIHLVFTLFSTNKTVPYAGHLALVTIVFLLFKTPINQFFAQLSGN